MAEKRRTIELLPGHLRTETLSKVFSATVDHLFQPESVEFLTGYVGKKPAWYDPTKDFYIGEPSKERADYQLAPTMVSKDYQSGNLTNALFYEDLIGQLRFQGALVNNHSRLFDQEYYSWSPPIDADKFVNFYNYYWLPYGPAAIELLDTTDLLNEVAGALNYTYTGTVKYDSTGEIVETSMPFTTGMKIVARADRTVSMNDREFIVELVGQGIRLVEIFSLANPGWDITSWDMSGWGGDDSLEYKQYVTINRASVDGNQWSATNRWFHIDVIKLSKEVNPDPYKQQARRPIIEFDRDINLYKYGFRNQGTVDLVDNTNGDFLGSVVGQSEWAIDRVPLRDGMRILVLADENANTNGKIYVVSGQLAGAIELTVEELNGNQDGSPAYGDRVNVRFGSFQGYNLYYDGTAWSYTGQQKQGTTIPPLFMLYDIDGNAMDDPSVYPSSTFAGSRVFGYTLDKNSGIDLELGINAKLDQFGDYVFSNDLSLDTITYVRDNRQQSYEGYLFAGLGSDDQYSNTWYRAPDPSRQYIVNEFVVIDGQEDFVIDQAPAPQVPNTLPTIMAYLILPNGTQVELRNGSDYLVSGNVVSIIIDITPGSRLIIKSWNKVAPSLINGYYEIPKNLSANPNNEEITYISRSQFLQQFVDIIGNQTGISGEILGRNNYRDTAKNRGLGLTILQHRAPMLKLGLMNTIRIDDMTSNQSPTDPMISMQFAQRSYQRFYNRFIQALFGLATKQGYSAGSSSTACDPYTISRWVDAALAQINVGKTPSSPWANSGPGGLPGAYCSSPSTSPTYVPASPARLGLTPVYQPTVYLDSWTYTDPRLVIQTHDGARIVMVNTQGEQLGTFVHGQTSTTNPEELTDPVAASWLQFELNLYNGLPAAYRNSDTKLAFDTREYSPGKWRSSDYTRNETLRLQRSFFDKWSVSGQIEFRANTGYDTTNQFSYNYRSVLDKNGQPVPGHWQGIYRWFYDTDRPHTHPWEMLGFSQKPEWWESQYGSAPYTRGNTAMWQDLRDGLIRQGSRAGVNSAWARPGLMDSIPVDDQGNLLPPFAAGCVASIPDVYSSKSEWIFGDGSPVESAWVYSQDYAFVMSQVGYLMKPARFIEYTWDSLRTVNSFSNTTSSQWLYIDTNSRRGSNEFYVHREKPNTLSIGVTIPNESDLAYFGSCGFQHWVSEYLINQGLSVTAYFGNLIRGCDVQLAQRMAGYINSNSLRATVDSFGEIGYNSQIVPNENINTYLYRSTSIGESIYSGVIVEQIRNGWKVYGYDPINQTFTIIPSNMNGPKNTIVIGNQKAIEYQTGLPTTSQVIYGTTFSTRQEVYDFLISYGRWLTQQGWVFDQYSEDANVVLNWTQSAKEFLFWSQGSWDNGTFIALSPSADSVRYFQEYGNIQYVNGIVAGAYPIVDKAGLPIQPQNIAVIREDGAVTVKPTNSQGIYGLRIYRTTLEHAVFFDNSTAFGDIIYQPLYDLRQERIKIYAYRTNDWNGRVDAPGYFLTKNTNTGTWSMATNFETTADDFRKYFNIEQPKNYSEINSVTGAIVQKTTEVGAVDRSDISNLARHLIGYQDRVYMQNLLLESATEFEFYQGFIRQKGTKSTIDRLLRNTSIIPANSSFEYYEEWLIRTGWYGATSLNNMIGYRLPQAKVVNDPQWIRLFSTSDSDYSGDEVLDVVPGDPLIVTPPESYQDRLFALRTSYAVDPATDLPTAGYAMLGETTWFVTNTEGLLNLYADRRSQLVPLQDRDTVWQFITDTGGWNVWILTKAISQIDFTIPSQVNDTPTIIATTAEHGLLEGDIVVIYGVFGLSVLNGTYVISNVTPKTFQIPVSTFEQGVGGTILVYRPLRFATIFDRDSGEPPGGWMDGDLAYVDEGGIVEGAWTVYKRALDKWYPYRQQEHRVAASQLIESRLYDSDTKELVSLIGYFDPIQGRISGKADAEINYKTDFDPAKYNKGNSTGYALSESEAWSSAQLGQVWWDLSTARYIDYGIGDEQYRIQHWGKVAPGTSIDVYEWIRSPVPPSDWASYVAKGESISDGGRTFIPTGSIRNPENPSWSEIVEYGAGGTSTTYYYFWVKNSGMAPWSPTRSLTTLNISALIENPEFDDLPWYAAVSSKSILVGNIQRLLNSDRIVHQITYSSTPNENNTFGEWELIREGDPMSPINDTAWGKLKSSLITFDGLNNDVPDYHLLTIQKYGAMIRPRQTWFENREAASKVFVDAFNTLISLNETPMVDDPSMAGWSVYFESAEPIPPQSGNWDYRVSDIGQRDALVGAIMPGQVVLVDPVSATDNLWTMWEYQPGTAPWMLIRKQSYNTSNYWNYVDWYLTGYGPNTSINYTVNDAGDLSTIDNPSTGNVAKVLNNGSNKWQLFVWLGEWRLVGQQDGSVEVLPEIYTWAESLGGFDDLSFDSTMFDMTAAVEFGNIIDGIKNAIYPEPDSMEMNTLFFAMLNYVVSEQGQVDWLVKTSNIVLKGFDQELTTAKLLSADNIDSIIGFVNEAKPYHSKIREFVSGKSTNDIARIGVVDFDYPPGLPYDTVPDDGTIEKNYYDTYQSWANNYLTNPELVRTLTTTMIFDRISTPSLRRGWGRIWAVFGWDESYGQNFGAIDRIEQYYQPTPGMVPKVIEDLMGGVVYKGYRLNALGFNVETGWGIGPWGGLLGWDPDPIAVENYLDQIIQGGDIPMYDVGVGNGITRNFPIAKDVTNPHNIVVWSDGGLRIYGVDWIVPTYAQNASVIDGGSGYSVGDQLDLIAGNGLAAARLRITAVDRGAITAVEIIGRGSYTTVLRGPYSAQYPAAYPGSGNNALFAINWFCNNIEFATAPQSSAVPNVFMLYSGTTFGPAPENDSDAVYDGNEFIQPFVDDDHPEELYPLRAKDALMMDVMTRRAGGRPIVNTRVYTTDGITDQYDLSVVPQNDDAVMAYLDGQPLVAGLADDFVINYDTRRMVFLATPLAGKTLHVAVIGTGGSSRLVSNAYVVTPGSGYLPGDAITLGGDIGQVSAVLQISSVTAVSTSITNPGAGYVVGDLLVLEGGTPVPGTSTVLRVVEVGNDGDIRSIAIDVAGEWTSIPTLPYSWNVSRPIGSGFIPASISISWGVSTGVVLNSGRYARIPDQPVSQSLPPASGGTGATWNLVFFGKINTYKFVGDGSNTDFYIPNTVSLAPSQFMVNVDGQLSYVSSVLINGVRLPSPPAYGATVIVTLFGSAEYSQVVETTIDITNPAVLSYSLSMTAASTIPTYISTLVRKNGDLLEPPLMQQFRGNGYMRTWNLTIDLTGYLGVFVYVDQIIKSGLITPLVNVEPPPGYDYIIDGDNRLVFADVNANNADIQILCIKSTTDYTIAGSIITFNAGSISVGDQIIVTTYNQDIDYEFHTEEYEPNIRNRYPLTKIPYDRNSIRVWQDGKLLVPMKDYLIEFEPRNEGWDMIAWDDWGWDVPTDDKDVIKIGDSLVTTNKVVITYMTGLPERPPIAWRTLTTDTSVMSTALDQDRQTVILNNVFTFSSTIEVADYTVLTPPTVNDPGYVYINNELIKFTEIQAAPSMAYPNRGFLSGLQRNQMGTSGSPTTLYNVQFYSGDGSETYFSTEAFNQAISRTVWVNEIMQIEGVDYEFVVMASPPLVGEYVSFVSPPPAGYKNIKISSLNRDSIETNVSHVILSTVIDAGTRTRFPAPYTWEPTIHGLQYSRTSQAIFLLNHQSSG
jgi:hypothetical protein